MQHAMKQRKAIEDKTGLVTKPSMVPVNGKLCQLGLKDPESMQ
jgi:hypothetical protein